MSRDQSTDAMGQTSRLQDDADIQSRASGRPLKVPSVSMFTRAAALLTLQAGGPHDNEYRARCRNCGSLAHSDNRRQCLTGGAGRWRRRLSQSQRLRPSKRLRSFHRDEPPVRESTSRSTPMLRGTGDCRVNFCSRHSLAAESEKKSEAARNGFLAAILLPPPNLGFLCVYDLN